MPLRLAVLMLALTAQAPAQTGSLLHIRVQLTPAGEPALPVARYPLLISDNPASAPPRRIFTDQNGAADVRLRPGNYTVESDQPFRFRGQAYTWTQLVDMVDGRDATLALSEANAEIQAVSGSTSAGDAPAADEAALLSEWQGSIVGVWSPTARGTAFIVDAAGLLVTSRSVVGTARSVEVQIDSATKVRGSVLAADSQQDVAVVAIDPSMLNAKPITVACGGVPNALAEDADLFALAAPLSGRKLSAAGTIEQVSGPTIQTDLGLPAGSGGGPVFDGSGRLIGLTTLLRDPQTFGRPEWSVVRIELACGAVADARSKRTEAAVPSPVLLPVEPDLVVTDEALAAAVKTRAGSLAAATMSSADFELTFITPVQIHGAEQEVRSGDPGRRVPTPDQRSLVEPLTDFANWSAYVALRPPVLFIRATPKLVESFWTTVGRYAARTQGVSLPPFKHVKAGFARMQAFCGANEVTPVHPLKLEHRVSEDEAVYEGFYAFDPAALTASCGEVRLVLYSDKNPDRGETRVVEPAVLQRIAADFEALKRGR